MKLMKQNKKKKLTGVEALRLEGLLELWSMLLDLDPSSASWSPVTICTHIIGLIIPLPTAMKLCVRERGKRMDSYEPPPKSIWKFDQRHVDHHHHHHVALDLLLHPPVPLLDHPLQSADAQVVLWSTEQKEIPSKDDSSTIGDWRLAVK